MMQVDLNYVIKIYTEKQKDGIKKQRLSDLWICDTIVQCALDLISPFVFVIFSWKLELILLADEIFLLFAAACILAILCHWTWDLCFCCSEIITCWLGFSTLPLLSAGKRPVASYNQRSKNALTEALLNFSLVGLSRFWLFLILWMECVATAMKATTVRAALSCATIYCALQGGRSEISCCDLFSQKATEQYFTVVPFIMLKVVVLNLTVSIQTKASSYGYSIAL